MDNNNEISDEMLIREIAKGATWPMEPLYERYCRLLYSLVYRMVSDHQLAEDLIQDAFVSAWSRASSYTPELGTVRSWLTTIAHNRAVDYLRRVRRRANLTQVPLEDAEHDEHTMQTDAEEEALHAIYSEKVREALTKLPTEQRRVIELSYFQAWTHSEIAAGYHIPLGTVKARMNLGIKRLRRILGQMGITEFEW